MQDDAELLRRYADEKSEPAFTKLVARHIDLVYSAALRQVGGDVHRAHDVAQIVFATLARRASSLGGHPALPGWLYNTTQHVARRTLRAEYRRRAREAEALRMSEIDRNDRSPVEWERIRPVLDDAMRELAERDREAVVLRFFARRPFAEIGRALGLSEDAARMRVERALEKLRGRLERRGVSSTASALSLGLGHQAVSAAPAGMVASVASSALAGAASEAAVGPVLSFFHLMNASKIVGGLGVLAAVLMVSTAVQHRRATQETQAALAMATRAHDALRAKITAAQQSAAAAEARIAEVQLSVAAALAAKSAERSQAPASPATRKPEPSTQDQIAAGQAFLAAHPDLKRVFTEGARARVASRYHSLYERFRLTPSQIERFEGLMMGRYETLNVDFSPEGLPRMILSTSAEASQTEGEIGQRVREILGEQGYQEYLDLRRPGGDYRTMLKVAGQLYSTPTPLTVDQAAQMQKILGESRQGDQRDWSAVFERGHGILAESQLEVLRGLHAQDELNDAVNGAKRRLQPASASSVKGVPPGKP
jgi:RNA polymerase sigma factor (sigma-70 family)